MQRSSCPYYAELIVKLVAISSPPTELNRHARKLM
jgi:hypothetical protein